MNPFQNFFHKVFSYTSIGRLLLANYLLQKNYLSVSGWNKSVRQRKPVDRNGEVLPWFTYSFAHFIQERINDKFHVFEFGSGNSTIWFSKFGCKIVSVEHDKTWYDIMQPTLSKNPKISYKLRDLESKKYIDEVTNYSDEFDIIVLDGRERVQCCLNALPALKKGGVILWDNSDRTEYEEGYKFLETNNFKRIDFHGMGPINSRAWCTSVFYKAGDNCLGI